MKRSTGIWVAAGVLAVACGGGLVYLRSQQVVAGSTDPSVRALLTEVLPPGQRLGSPSALPWDALDVQWAWAPVGLAATPPAGAFGWQPLGLVSLAVTPEAPDTQAWWASVKASPLALAGRGDAELVAALFFAADQGLPSQALEPVVAVLAGDPSAGLGADGLLAPDHPWKAAVDVLRRWQDQGLLAAGWTDWSGQDAVAAVEEGRARWAVLSADQALARAGTGVRTLVVRPLPVPPGRTSATALGRALRMQAGTGWAAADRVASFTKAAAAPETARLWLIRGGLVLTADQPAVDQESRALGLAFRSAGRLVTLPGAETDLGKAHALLEVVRTELRR